MSEIRHLIDECLGHYFLVTTCKLKWMSDNNIAIFRKKRHCNIPPNPSCLIEIRFLFSVTRDDDKAEVEEDDTPEVCILQLLCRIRWVGRFD